MLCRDGVITKEPSEALHQIALLSREITSQIVIDTQSRLGLGSVGVRQNYFGFRFAFSGSEKFCSCVFHSLDRRQAPQTKLLVSSRRVFHGRYRFTTTANGRRANVDTIEEQTDVVVVASDVSATRQVGEIAAVGTRRSD